ncbi:hypothetical protein ACX1NX_10405 [Acinetobacter sp. ANC 5383]
MLNLSGKYALLPPVGIDPVHGASSFYSEEANIAQAMVKQAKQTFILADQSKLGVVSRVRYAQSHEISMLISNQEAKSEIDLASYQQYFQQIIRA